MNRSAQRYETYCIIIINGFVLADKFTKQQKPGRLIRSSTDNNVMSSNTINSYIRNNDRGFVVHPCRTEQLRSSFFCRTVVEWNHLGPYAPQGSTILLPKLSVTSKVSARTSCAWVGSRVRFRSSEDVTLLEFTSPIDPEYMRRCQKFH